MKVIFESNDKNFLLKDNRRIKQWVEDTIRKEGKVRGQINFQFVESKEIKRINYKYLNHNYPTDIITFNKSFLNIISGDIYICAGVVKKNTSEFSEKSFKNELYRVIIHGILHLLGYNDIKMKDIEIMRSKEDLYLYNLETF